MKKRIISLILTLAMVLSLFAGLTLFAEAATVAQLTLATGTNLHTIFARPDGTINSPTTQVVIMAHKDDIPNTYAAFKAAGITGTYVTASNKSPLVYMYPAKLIVDVKKYSLQENMNTLASILKNNLDCVDQNGVVSIQPFSYLSTSSTAAIIRVAFVINTDSTYSKMIFNSDSSQMFKSLTDLLCVKIQSADLSNVQNMSQMFYGCTSLGAKLNNVAIPGVTVYNNVTGSNAYYNVEEMFRNCTTLQTLDARPFFGNTNGVAYDSMFRNCTKLTTVYAPPIYDTGDMDPTSINSMFYGCSSLRTIYAESPAYDYEDLPDSEDEDYESEGLAGTNVFYGCTSLVGENGTTYDANHVGLTYARIDGTGTMWHDGDYDNHAKGYFTGTYSYVRANHDNHCVDNDPGNACYTEYDGHGELMYRRRLVSQATCTAPAQYRYICEQCGYGFLESSGSALGHSYGAWSVTTPATCTTGGVETRTCSRCNGTETRNTSSLGHSYGAWVVTTAATCTTAGVETRICSRCNGTETRSISALGHSYGSWTVTTAPTCTQTGVETRTCSRCSGTDTRSVASLGHNYQQTGHVNATCTAGGYDTYTCSRCNDSYNTNQVAALGHNLSYTFNGDGTHTTSCSRCDYENIADCVDANNDNVCDVCGGALFLDETPVFEKITSASELTTGQYLIVYEAGALALDGAKTPKIDATNNGVAITKVNNRIRATDEALAAAFIYNANNHSFKSTNGKYIGRASDANGLEETTTAASNTVSFNADGSVNIVAAGGAYLRFNNGASDQRFRYYKSSSYTSQQPIYLYKLLGGEPVHAVAYAAPVAATCTTAGTVGYYYCTDAGCALAGKYFEDEDLTQELTSISVPALGHNYGAWVVTTAATCTAAGVETRTCSRCNAQETRAIAATGHDYQQEHVDATCTEAGHDTFTCSRCGDHYTTMIAALGHNFGDWVVTTPATCTEEGVKTKTCSRCGATETQSIEENGHDFSLTEHVAATCTEGGYDLYTCDVCGETYTDNETPALGHNYGAWVVTTAATCTAAGVQTKTCSRCGDKQTQAIAALGHNLSTVSNNDGTHTTSCSRCDYSVTEACTFENGVCTVCGYQEQQGGVEIIDVSDTLKFVNKTVSVGDVLEPLFYITKSVKNSYDNVSMKITYIDSKGLGLKGEPEEVTEERGEDLLQQKGNRYYWSQKIFAGAMTDAFTITLYGRNEAEPNKLYKGESMTTSLRDMFMEKFTESPANAQQLAVNKTVANLLNYGAASQSYFHYHEDDLATSKLGSYAQYVTTTDPEVEDTIPEPTANAGATITAVANYTLALEETIGLQWGLNLKTLDVNTLHALITYTDYQGTPIAVTIPGSEFSRIGTTNRYNIKYKGLHAADGRKYVSMTIYDANNKAVSNTYSFSLQNKVNNQPDEVKPLTKAMMNYYLSVEELMDALS